MKILSIILFIVSITFAAEQNKLDKVTLFLKWKHQFQFAGFYIAKEKGFYKELGLDVTIKESKNNQNNTNLVLNNQNTFGISDSELIYEKVLGKKISLLGAIFQHSPLVFLSLEANKIITPNDFFNKKIMVDFNKKQNILLNIFIKQYGVDKKNLKIMPSSYNIDDLITGKVDLFTAYMTNELYTLQDKKIDYNYINPADYGYDFYGDILFTSLENVKNNPKKVDSFYEASLRGWKYAFSHIDETINLILEKYNTQNFSYKKYIYEANILKELSEIEKGNLGKLELSKINNILSLYFLTMGNFNSKIINDLDISASVKSYQSLNIDINEKKEEMEDELIKLIKKPFYEMNEEKIKDIFDIFLEKNYIIALQLHDTFSKLLYNYMILFQIK
jgi:polar amino acid transport system substrate-binding protein